jgi:hypothetical protein
MADLIPVLVAPSGRDLTRDYMIEQLALRDPPITGSWTTGIPTSRPKRFFTIEDLNVAEPHGILAESQMIQIRCYDADLAWLTPTMRLLKAVWKVMPVWVHPTVPPPNGGLQAQDVEHAGGPIYDQDPNVPGLYYGQLIAWVTVMTEKV